MRILPVTCVIFFLFLLKSSCFNAAVDLRAGLHPASRIMKTASGFSSLRLAKVAVLPHRHGNGLLVDHPGRPEECDIYFSILARWA